jgi:hypothetical protein
VLSTEQFSAFGCWTKLIESRPSMSLPKYDCTTVSLQAIVHLNIIASVYSLLCRGIVLQYVTRLDVTRSWSITQVAALICILFMKGFVFYLPWRSPQWVRASSLSTIHSHTQTHHPRCDSSGRVISPTQRPLRDNNTQHTTLTRDRHPCPRRDSNPQSQQASDRRPTP